MIRQLSLRLLCVTILTLFAAPLVMAQNESGTITGAVTDPTGAVVPGAAVTIVDLGTNTIRTAKTGPNGEYTFSTLRPSHYKISVTAAGFKESLISDVELHTQDKISQNVALSLGESSDTVNVSAETPQLETTAAVATTVDREFIENMPLNGRSFQALISLAPGSVTAKTYYTSSGQFSVDGQRTDANYFSIDGVSANVGITQGSNVYLGSAGAGASPATSNNGGYNNLVSIDDMQEYKIQTSSFDAEYGRTPGAQLSIVTRSGTNQFHGTAFEYLRNEVFDANTWFNNNAGLARAGEKQNDFGGVIGGPMWHDKLFFFFSFEGLRLRVPESRQDVVPTSYARSLANATVAPLLMAYPLPSAGQDIAGNYTGLFKTTFSNPSTLNATSLRLDYALNSSVNFFVRGDYAPSSGAQYGAFDFYTRSTYSHTIANLDTITAGATFVVKPNLIDDFRFNISHSKGATVVTPTTFGGATIPTDAYLFQSNPTYTTNTSVFSLFFDDGTTDYYVGNDATNHQRQLNFVDTMSWIKGRHNFKFGGDYRRLTPTNGYRPWDISYDFADVQTLVTTGVPVYAGIDSTDTSELRPVFNNLSFFAEDAWQLNSRLTVNYGLRWDFGPPPSENSGHPFFTATNLDSPANVALAPKGTKLWESDKHNFAPRLGISYEVHKSPNFETVFRGGGGIFYGLGNQQGAQGTLGFPYSRANYLYGTDGTYPLSTAAAAPIPYSLNPPYSFVFAFDPHLKDPKVYMWNASLQQNVGEGRSLQLTYVGNLGDDLLRHEMLTPAMGANANFQYLDVITNNDHANYNALQVQFKQNPWHHLQFLASYAWAHALDNGSGVSVPIPYHTVYNPSLDYGNSENDVRNMLSAAVTYEVPKVSGGNSIARYLANGWATDSLFRSNSALPINITTGQFSFGLVWNNDAINQRPNVVSDQPFFRPDSTAPGGKVVNAAAFSTPTDTFSQGNLGRNQLRGFSAWQEDLAIRRDFAIHEDWNLQFRAEAFNIFNHPLFGDIGTNDGRNLLNSPFFGVSSHTLADSLGGGGADGGFSSLYQIGSPRSLQFALKLRF
jgi:outer membrane receptor protein involved in Fe transport